jgi:aryl sulfotransferase
MMERLFGHIGKIYAVGGRCAIIANVKLVHFADLKRDLAGQIRDIAKYLEIDVAPNIMDDIVYHCSFDYMKENASAAAPLGGAFWDGGAKTFVHKGTNGRWHDELAPKVSDRYLTRAEQELGHDCAMWLAEGQIS